MAKVQSGIARVAENHQTLSKLDDEQGKLIQALAANHAKKTVAMRQQGAEIAAAETAAGELDHLALSSNSSEPVATGLPVRQAAAGVRAGGGKKMKYPVGCLPQKRKKMKDPGTQPAAAPDSESSDDGESSNESDSQAVASDALAQPALNALLRDLRAEREARGKGTVNGAVPRPTGSNIRTVADLPGSEVCGALMHPESVLLSRRSFARLVVQQSEDEAPAPKMAKPAIKKKSAAKRQPADDLTKVSWDSFDGMSGGDASEADTDEDYQPDSKPANSTAVPKRNLRSLGLPPVPRNSDSWSCTKCQRRNPPNQEACSGKSCDGERENGTVLSLPPSVAPAKKQVRQPVERTTDRTHAIRPSHAAVGCCLAGIRTKEASCPPAACQAAATRR